MAGLYTDSAENAVHKALKDHAANPDDIRSSIGHLCGKHGKDVVFEALLHCSQVAYKRMHYAVKREERQAEALEDARAEMESVLEGRHLTNP